MRPWRSIAKGSEGRQEKQSHLNAEKKPQINQIDFVISRLLFDSRVTRWSILIVILKMVDSFIAG